MDTQKLGLWPGGFLTVQAEGNYGENVNGSTGALIPVNTSAIFPMADAKQFVLPHWYFDQRVRSILIPRLPVSQHDGSWAVYYNFDQYLYQPEKNVDRGLFGRFAASDGVANPLKYFYSIGLGGKGLIPIRPLDQFGIGYFYGTVGTAQIPSSLGFHDIQGFEAYYNI